MPSSAFDGLSPLIISATPAFDRGGSRVFEIGPSDLYIRNKAEASEKLRNLGALIGPKKKGRRNAVDSPTATPIRRLAPVARPPGACRCGKPEFEQ